MIVALRIQRLDGRERIDHFDDHRDAVRSNDVVGALQAFDDAGVRPEKPEAFAPGNDGFGLDDDQGRTPIIPKRGIATTVGFDRTSSI